MYYSKAFTTQIITYFSAYNIYKNTSSLFLFLLNAYLKG